MPPVGKEVATFIGRLSAAFNYPLIDFTLIGFSLGAHIAGNIGKALNGEIGVIIALDPAGPFISSTNSSFSVYPTDAKYVQVFCGADIKFLALFDVVLGHSYKWRYLGND